MTRPSNHRRWRLIAAAAASIPILAMINPGAASAQTSPGDPAWYEANGASVDRNNNWGALTWDGAASYAPGMQVTGFNFDGTNGVYSTDPALGAFGTNDFIVEFDISTTANSTQVLSHRGNELGGATCGSTPEWQVSLTPGGAVGMSMQTSYPQTPSNSFGVVSAVPVNDGKLHTVSIVRRGSDITLAVDGTHVNSGTLPGNLDLGTGGPLTFEAGNGNPCSGPGEPATPPFVGMLDNLYLGNGPLTDLTVTEPTVPTVPAGSSGSLTLQLNNPSAATVPLITYNLTPVDPALTITGVSGIPGCTFTASSISCVDPVPSLSPGSTPLTVHFTVNGDAAPGSTLTSGQALVNQTVPDPDQYNDQLDTPMLVQVAPVNGSPMADWSIAGGVGALLLLLLGCGWLVRRRRLATVRP